MRLVPVEKQPCEGVSTAGLLEAGIRRAIWVLQRHQQIDGSRLVMHLLNDVLRQAGLEGCSPEDLAG